MLAFFANEWNFYATRACRRSRETAAHTDLKTQEQIARTGTSRLLELRDKASESYEIPVPPLTGPQKSVFSREMGGAIVAGASKRSTDLTEQAIDRETGSPVLRGDRRRSVASSRSAQRLRQAAD